MGFSHYFRTHKDGIPVSAWDKICADVQTLLSNLPAGLNLVLEYDEPNSTPVITSSLIQFNGIGDDGHESFYFERTPAPNPPGIEERGDDTIFAFCKTANKPYDLAVCGTLLVINRHAYKYVSISSDGDRADWLPAVEWVAATLGSSYPLPTGVWTDSGNLPDPTIPDESVPTNDDLMLGDPDEYDDSGGEDTPALKPEPVTTSHAFVVDVKEFRAALEMGVCEKKDTIPVLKTVALQPQGSSLRVVSTDLEKWTLTDVPAMIDDGAGTVLLPHKKTLELLKGETGILRITSKVTTLSDKFSHAWIKLSLGDCEYDLPSINPANFPALPVVPTVGFDVSGSDLKLSIGRIIGCISTEESRYTLNGALFECEGYNLRLVATDGHRLALDSVTLSETRKGKALIPRESMAWLYKHSAGEIGITFGEEQSFFHVASTVFVTRNVKGQFPNWQAVTPRQDSFNLTASFPSGDELAKTLAKVARMADERSGAVKIALNGRCVLSASSIDTGSASATVKASINHSPDVSEIVAGFNSSYVLDVLKIAGKSPVALSLKDAQSAGVFTVPSLPEYKYVLMPMRV